MERRKRQQRKACTLCRRRKVRCNIDETGGPPCAVCEKAGYECWTQDVWPAPRRGPPGVRGATSRRRLAENTERTDQSVSPAWRAEPASSAPQRTLSVASSGEGAPDSALSTTACPPDESDYLARTGLLRFFEKGIDFNQWRVFENASDFRIAYVGTPVSNLAHLVKLRLQHASAAETLLPDELFFDFYDGADGASTVTASASTTALRTNGKHQRTPLHFPYPQIRPIRSRDPNLHTIFHAAQHLTSDLSSFPDQEVRDALVNAFFDNIHPSFPILSRSTFIGPDGRSRDNPPILLLQAVLMAGVHACSHPLVQNAPSMMKAVLFRRAAMLFHLRHEVDRLHLTQAALLFTWHINDGDTVAGGYQYWTGVAMRITCGQGTHRHNEKLPTLERVLYKRTFWYAFISEVFSALETGRPCAIRAEDIDQSLPTQEELDWEEYPPAHDAEDSSASPSKTAPLKYHVQMIALAFIALDVLAINAPCAQQQPKDIANIDARLAQWLLRSDLSTGTSEESFFNSFLRLQYNTVVIHLHRNINKDSMEEQKTSSTAAESILAELEHIMTLDCLRRCHFPVIGAVTAAGIQLVQEIRLALDVNMLLVSLSLLEKLRRLLRIAKALAESWPNAEAIYNVFESLRKQYEQQMSQGLDYANEVTLPDNLADWNCLFDAAPGLDHLDQFTAEQDWLSLMNRADL